MSNIANKIELDAAQALLQLQGSPGLAQMKTAGEEPLPLNCVLTPVTTQILSDKTRDQGTQTDRVTCQSSAMTDVFQQLGVVLWGLREKFNSLENLHKGTSKPSASTFVPEKKSAIFTSNIKMRPHGQSNADSKRKNQKPCTGSRNTPNTTIATNNGVRKLIYGQLQPRMVRIGHGYASVPARVLRRMNWASHTSATRTLLTSVFSRRVLATHSLTGKPSPAFPGKPAKKQLDPDVINDIVQLVVERSKVSASVVRTSITSKCADEDKVSRKRQKNTKNYPLL